MHLLKVFFKGKLINYMLRRPIKTGLTSSLSPRVPGLRNLYQHPSPSPSPSNTRLLASTPLLRGLEALRRDD